jgi:hypothetical protein
VIVNLKRQLHRERAKHCFTKPHDVRRDRPAPRYLRLSIQGSYRLAIKRNVGHIGQRALTAVVEAGVGRQAVSRSELLLASFFTQAAKFWYGSMYERLQLFAQQVSMSSKRPLALLHARSDPLLLMLDVIRSVSTCSGMPKPCLPCSVLR